MPVSCRLPRTATRRNAVAYVKLLERVEARAETGFDFVGRLLRPGDHIDESELLAFRAGTPIALECTDAEGAAGPRERRRWEKLYILWRYEAASGETSGRWIEIARCRSLTADWAPQLREAARLALGRQSWTVVPKLAEVSARIRVLLDQELLPLDEAMRRQVLADLHEQFAARIVDSAEVA